MQCIAKYMHIHEAHDRLDGKTMCVGPAKKNSKHGINSTGKVIEAIRYIFFILVLSLGASLPKGTLEYVSAIEYHLGLKLVTTAWNRYCRWPALVWP